MNPIGMQARWLVVVGVALLPLAAGTGLALFRPGPGQLRLTLLQVEQVQPSPINDGVSGTLVTFGVSNCGPQGVGFCDREALSIRVGNDWSPEASLDLCLRGLRPGASTAAPTVLVPPGTDALRLSLRYRFGRSRYCQAYSFFSRHGLFQRFPSTCQWALSHFPHQLDRTETTLELRLP